MLSICRAPKTRMRSVSLTKLSAETGGVRDMVHLTCMGT